jgi:hypothetical protein
MRNIVVRVSEDRRAQLELIAQLDERSVSEEIRVGLEDWIDRSKVDPNVLKRADAVRAEIEHEATTKRNAIEAIFSTEEKPKGAIPRRDATKDKTPGS